MKFDIWIFLENLSRKIQFSLKSDKNKGYFTWRPIYIFLSYLAQFILEWKTFQTITVDKLEPHVSCTVICFRKSCRLWNNVEKYCRAKHVTDDNMAHAHCMLDTKGYKYTHSGCVLLTAFPLQRLHERASMLRNMYIACLLCKVLSVQNWSYYV
jgi:hypothetical protein